VLAGIALGAWALFAFSQRTEMAAPATEEATTDTAANETPAAESKPSGGDTAAAPAGEQKPSGDDAKSAGAPAGDAKTAGGDTAAAPAGEQKPAGGEQKPAGGDTAATESGGGGAAASGNPEEVAKSAEKGSLKSPISDPKSAAGEGQKVFMAAGCNGCHGGTGGGGMGPPLTNEIWIYGSDDDTLFRLIALGSDGLKAEGYGRKGSESVVGPMPAHGKIVKSSEDLWKIIAWIRSINPSSAGGDTTAAGGGDAAAPTGGGNSPPSAPPSAPAGQ
jgi:mono/diheme cytochrome c family protein